jgi:hypothetical protein
MTIANARVTPEGVFIGDQKLPDHIAEDGVSASTEYGGPSYLTVKFIVDRVEFASIDEYDEHRNAQGKTPIVQPNDVRGMTCSQAVVMTGKPCKGECTRDFSDSTLPTIADPDCFR